MLWNVVKSQDSGLMLKVVHICSLIKKHTGSKFGCLFRIIGFKYNDRNQVTYSKCYIATSHSNWCSESTNSQVFDQKKKKKTIHNLYWLWCLHKPWMNVCWLLGQNMTNLHPAAFQTSRTTTSCAQTHLCVSIHAKNNSFRRWASLTIALSWNSHKLHLQVSAD